VFGWPDEDGTNKELQGFYPTDLLETGYDILFFWVARMVFFGRQLTGKLPFHSVFLHSMVRDKHGRKMSKSLGNVIDPLEIIEGCSLQNLLDKLDAGNLPEKEVTKAKKAQTADFPQGIPEVGADALRFGLLSYTSQTGDINLDINRLVGYRNFCNKLWNATRFALSNIGDDFKRTETMQADLIQHPGLAARDKFILHRLNVAVNNVNDAIKRYSFGEATQAAYGFWLYDLCDVYLELIKPVCNVKAEEETSETKLAKEAAQQTLWVCLDNGLRMLHPMMPYVTEELWQRLPGRNAKDEPSICIAQYPVNDNDWCNPQAENDMELARKAIHAARSMRADYKLANNVRPQFFLKTATEETAEVMRKHFQDFVTLAKADGTSSEVLFGKEAPAGCAMFSVNEDIQVHVQLKGLIDFEAEIKKLQSKQKDIEGRMDILNRKMTKEGYEENVPAKVKEANKSKYEGMVQEIEAIATAIKGMEKMNI